MTKKNPIAKDLRTVKYRPKIVKNKKTYDRKSNQSKRDDGEGSKDSSSCHPLNFI